MPVSSLHQVVRSIIGHPTPPYNTLGDIWMSAVRRGHHWGVMLRPSTDDDDDHDAVVQYNIRLLSKWQNALHENVKKDRNK